MLTALLEQIFAYRFELIGVVVVVLLGYLVVLAHATYLKLFEPSILIWHHQTDCDLEKSEKKVGEVTIKLDITAPRMRPITLTFIIFNLKEKHRQKGTLAGIVDKESALLGSDDPERRHNDGFLAVWRYLNAGETHSILLTIRTSRTGNKLRPWYYVMKGDLRLQYIVGDVTTSASVSVGRGIEANWGLPVLGGNGRYLCKGGVAIPGFDVSRQIEIVDEIESRELYHPAQNWPNRTPDLKMDWEEFYEDWLSELSVRTDKLQRPSG